MIIQLISQYLETHRRLVIPGVGAFMVKGDDKSVLFSVLLKKDDGVLRTLLKDQGLSAIEVAATVDRFIFEIKHATESVGGEFVMEDFGILRHEEGVKLVFVSLDEAAPSDEVASTEDQSQAEPSCETMGDDTLPLPQVVESGPRVESKQVAGSKPAEDKVLGGPVDVEPEESLENIRYTKDKIKSLYSKPPTFRERDSDVEDLTYSKRQKPLNGYTYVRKNAGGGGIDKVLLFGIIAAVIAIGVIIYGYYVANIDEISDMMIRWGLKSVESTSEF